MGVLLLLHLNIRDVLLLKRKGVKEVFFFYRKEGVSSSRGEWGFFCYSLKEKVKQARRRHPV